MSDSTAAKGCEPVLKESLKGLDVNDTNKSRKSELMLVPSFLLKAYDIL